jgi:hypothetical protein
MPQLTEINIPNPNSNTYDLTLLPKTTTVPATLLPTTPEVYKTSLKSHPFKLAAHDSKTAKSYWGRGTRR